MKKVVPDEVVLIPDGAQRVFEGLIYDVFHWQQEQFDGTEKTFEMLRRPDTVVAVCIVEDKIVVLDDTQPHSGTKKSFPGGRVDATDASILDAAQRETLEETGYSFRNWRLIDVAQLTTKMEWFCYAYLAWGVTGHDEPEYDAGEKILVNLMTFEEVKHLCNDHIGHMTEAYSLFKPLTGIEQLLALPEFSGKEIER